MNRLALGWLAALHVCGCVGSVAVSGDGNPGGSTGSSGGAGNGGAPGVSGGGAASSDSTASDSTSSVPPECAAPSNGPGPYPVTFHFTNATGAPIYLHEDCNPSYTLSSCAGGYQDSFGGFGQCADDCAHPNPYGCMSCFCMLQAPSVTKGTPFDLPWDGHERTPGGTDANGCACLHNAVAPAGKYRITVPVYASEMDAITGDLQDLVTIDFDLPAPNGVVDVPLSLPQK